MDLEFKNAEELGNAWEIFWIFEIPVFDFS